MRIALVGRQVHRLIAVKVRRRKILTADVMRTAASNLIADQRRGQIVPRTRQEAINLLIGALHVMTVLVGTRSAIRIGVRRDSSRAILRVIERDYWTVYGLNRVSAVRRINPGFAVIVKVGIESLDIYVRPRLYVVVDARGKAVARSVVIVGALVLAVCHSHVTALRVLHDGLGRLEVVDTAVRLIGSAAQECAEFLAGAEAPANRAVNPSSSVAILNGVVSALAG